MLNYARQLLFVAATKAVRGCVLFATCVDPSGKQQTGHKIPVTYREAKSNLAAKSIRRRDAGRPCVTTADANEVMILHKLDPRGSPGARYSVGRAARLIRYAPGNVCPADNGRVYG